MIVDAQVDHPVDAQAGRVGVPQSLDDKRRRLLTALVATGRLPGFEGR